MTTSKKPGRELRAEVPGGNVVAWQAGAGPWALVLHGGPGLSDYTESLADELEDASAPSRTAGPAT